MICHWYEAPTYLFFAADLPGLLYYSHIPGMVLALAVGVYVYWNNRDALLNRLLLLISLAFTAWILINLVAWTNINVGTLLFYWTFFGILQALISILAIYFIYVFLYKNDVPNWMKWVFLILLLPVIILAPSNFHLSGFNLDWCDAFGYENTWYLGYYSLLGIVAMIWTGILLVLKYRTADIQQRSQIRLMGFGMQFFLFSFFTITFLASYLANLNIVNDSDLEFYGLFGMTVFMVQIGIQIVKFKTFNVGALAPQALTVALVILIGSQYTYANSTPTTLTLTTITLILTGIAGVLLIRSVKHEISQRTEIEKLAKRLERANKRLKVLDKMKSEFVSIASHQLRSPLTSIRGYASMLLEGSYGKLPQKAVDAVERISDSSRYMATSVEDYLNVSRIQAGNMKYEYTDFNLKDKAEHIADDIRREAMKKGLLLTFKSDLDKQGIVHADIGKVQQILHNLINNALKYTPKGMVTVFVHDHKKRIMVDVIDTGIGMKPETVDDMFEKFERAENANEVNVSGTGLGLYIARKMAEEMGGSVYASSDGEGKGSTFTLELPLMQ